MKYEDWLKNKDLKYKNGILNIANVSTIELVEKFGMDSFKMICRQIIENSEKKLRKRLAKLPDGTPRYTPQP